MIVAISQPEHFPYLGYFYKMNMCDLFIVLDHVAYGGRKSYQSRNKFTNLNGDIEWLTASLQNPVRNVPINEVKLSSCDRWKEKQIKKIQYNFNIDLSHIYEEHKDLKSLNMASIEFLRERLQINTPIVYSSDYGCSMKKSDLLVELCQKVNARTYLSGLGGKSYLDTTIFADNNINVCYMDRSVPDYMSAISHIK